jgi:hypothetical protein
MTSLTRLEVWSDYQCNAGVRVAFLPLDHVTRLTTTTRITRDDEGSLELSKDAAATASIDTGSVIRWLFSDGSFDEWRVRELEDTSRSARMVRASLQSPLYELNVGAAVITETVSGTIDVGVDYKSLTPAEVLASILAFCPTWFTAGTVTPTIPVNVVTDGWMPLRALRELVSAIKGQGVSCELDVRRNGTTGYFLDLVTAIGSSAAAVDVRTAKNLLSTTRQRDRQKYATEVVPIGPTADGVRSTIARAYLEVTAKSAPTLTVQAPVTGGNVIAFDGQFDGLYLIDDANAKQVITNSGVDQQFDVASATNVTVGRWYRFALNSSGDELVRVRKAPATAGPIKVLESSALDNTTNFFDNPSMREWAGASTDPPDNWTKTGTGILTRTTTVGLWIYGGKSCKIDSQTGAASVLLNTPALSLYVPSYAVTAHFRAWVYVTTGHATGVVRFLYDSSVVSTTTTDTLAVNQWVEVSYAHPLTTTVGAVRTFQVQAGGLSVFGIHYLDSAQVTLSTSARAFTEGSNATRLLTLANQYLTAYSTVPAAYSVQFADLEGWDPTSFPYDAVTLGGTANVRDTDLGITTSGRMVDITKDWRNPLASAITVANRPVDLITTLSGIAA